MHGCRCKVEVGQVHKTEHGEITLDNRCWIRSGHTLTQVGQLQGCTARKLQAVMPLYARLLGRRMWKWSSSPRRASRAPECWACKAHHGQRTATPLLAACGEALNGRVGTEAAITS